MNITTECQTPVTPGQINKENPSFLFCQQPHGNFRDLDNDELQVLISLANNTLRDRGVSTPTTVPPAPKAPDIFDNARFEQIASKICSSPRGSVTGVLWRSFRSRKENILLELRTFSFL
jgi:hypothetical protein